MMSDQVVLFRDGQIDQAGTPRELHGSPRTEFAARFIANAPLLAARSDRLSLGPADYRFGAEQLFGARGGFPRREPADSAAPAVVTDEPCW
jgi:ABC-type sulfate/molybdate transport systems ATPase subunit